MIKASFDNAQDDMQARELAEQRVEADRVIESVMWHYNKMGQTY